MACSLKLNFVPFLWMKQCLNTLLTIPCPLSGPHNPSRIPPCFQNKIYIPFFVDPMNSPSSSLATISHSLFQAYTYLALFLLAPPTPVPLHKVISKLKALRPMPYFIQTADFLTIQTFTQTSPSPGFHLNH